MIQANEHLLLYPYYFHALRGPTIFLLFCLLSLLRSKNHWLHFDLLSKTHQCNSIYLWDQQWFIKHVAYGFSEYNLLFIVFSHVIILFHHYYFWSNWNSIKSNDNKLFGIYLQCIQSCVIKLRVKRRSDSKLGEYFHWNMLLAINPLMFCATLSQYESMEHRYGFNLFISNKKPNKGESSKSNLRFISSVWCSHFVSEC